APDAIVTATFAGGDPAVVEFPVGTGRIIWWAFSLRPDWSDLGIRAAPILIRLHQLGGKTALQTPHVANVMCDQSIDLAFAAGPAATTVRVERVAPSQAGERPTLMSVEPSGRFHISATAAGL